MDLLIFDFEYNLIVFISLYFIEFKIIKITNPNPKL
jgi:hypothetical protein